MHRPIYRCATCEKVLDINGEANAQIVAISTNQEAAIINVQMVAVISPMTKATIASRTMFCCECSVGKGLERLRLVLLTFF